MSTKSKWDDYIRTEGFKDYYCIEAYQYVVGMEERSLVIREIEASKTPEEAKAIIQRARGILS